MAKAKKQSSRRTSPAQSKGRKTSKKGFLQNFKTRFTAMGAKKRMAVFVLLFGLVGAAALFPLLAEGEIPGRPDEIVFQLEHGSTLDQEANGSDGHATYMQAPFLMRLTGDGVLLCDDGSNVSLIQVKLEKQQVQRMYKEVMSSGLFDAADDTLTDSKIAVGENFRRISIGNIQHGLHHFSVHSGTDVDKVEVFERVALKLQQPCVENGESTQKVDRKGIAKAKEKANEKSMVQRVLSNLRPQQAWASHKTNHVSGGGSTDSGSGTNNKGGKNKDTTSSDDSTTGSEVGGEGTTSYTDNPKSQYGYSAATDQFNRINSHRATHSIHALQRMECIDKVAFEWSYQMAVNGDISHNNNRTSQVLASCNRTDWEISGENVGVGYSSESLFPAFIASTCHHANIDGQEYILDSEKRCQGVAPGSYPGQKKLTNVGVGAYYDATGRMFVTHIFWKWSNTSSTGGGTTTNPPTTVSYDNASCNAISVSKTTVAPGETFSASVQLYNAGNVTWQLGSSGGYWRLGSSDPRNNTRWGISRANSSGTVAPGGFATFNFSAKAPTGVSDGVYSFNWEMLKEGSYWLGDQTPEPDGQTLYPVCKKSVTIKNTTTSGGTSGGTTTSCPTGADIMCGGRTLYSGNEISSALGYYKFRVFTGNGEVVLRRNGTTTDYWSSGTASSPAGSRAVMQTDGNLVVYTADGKTCHTGTYGNSGAFMKVQDDGKFVIYNASRSAIWQSNIDGRYGSRWYGGCDNRSAY